MKIKFIGHSSLIIRTDSCGILCDPWLSGRVFNNGWALSPQPRFTHEDLSGVNYLWISHEHPDHMHFPSLTELPEAFKSTVTVIFQSNNSSKVSSALAKIGFRNFQSVKHNSLERLGAAGDWFAVYQHRHLDSALIVRAANGQQIINANDAELTQEDCTILRRKFGKFTALFKQFSIAGFDGITANVRAEAAPIVHSMIAHHQWLDADVTCPIASFMYFCMPDNFHLNEYTNDVLSVQRAFTEKGLACHLMYPGAERQLSELRASPGDVTEYEHYYRTRQLELYPLEKPVGVEEVANAFRATVAAWKKRFPALLVNRIGTITVSCLDHGCSYDLNFRTGEMTESSSASLLKINSQPLFFAFRFPFGVQTLGVSGRYNLEKLPFEWKLVRVISSLYNAEIYLRPRYLLSGKTLKWLYQRRAGLLTTVRQQIARFSA